eukprot:NODE_4465_length_1164_cov_42.505283_g3948_i0.p1 GENE.NODE_4465_length_1164_cov_42.505283_g3948_i0~~NODE_4465_length_1164_cov_42.505283_g3948_i0.p1  ORF type:complete len:344 (-),score=45.75 NODE_4465_length_1164_cov_42.505283_g3948_i0:75-1106(-)
MNRITRILPKVICSRYISTKAIQKVGLIVIPCPNIQPLVDPLIRSQLSPYFSDIAVGQNYSAFQQLLSDNESFVLCCGMFMPGLKELVSEIITESPKAKPVWIHSLLVGVDHLLTPAVKNSNCPVTNAKGCFSRSLAEYVICACLHFEKDVPRLVANQQLRRWDRFVMGELYGKTMGIVGMGDIGHTVSGLAKAFGMNIISIRRSSSDHEVEHLFKSSDYIVAALPGTKDTFHFINESRLNLMKNSAVFINIGRGITVDQKALAKHLSEKKIRGAALDVFEQEPLPSDDPIYNSLENLLLSPHNADNTEDYYPSTVRRFVELTQNYYLHQKNFPSLVDLNLGY